MAKISIEKPMSSEIDEPIGVRKRSRVLNFCRLTEILGDL
jgi:hypothetical protein